MTIQSYYNYNKLYSHNAYYNFLVGARGLGKTHGIKKKAIQNAIRKGEQFIYLRRYKTELAAARDTFFADVYHYFPKYDFRVFGSRAEMSKKILPIPGEAEKEFKQRERKRTWQTIGYFAALSTAQKLKSVSYPLVTVIIYDEFIIEKGALQYLPNEAEVFNNFYSTVDRWKDKTKVFFLANSVSIMNPYFIKYNIKPDELSEFVVLADGYIVCHFPDSEAFRNEVFETKFGKFIEKTDYADYAVGNAFSDNHDNLIDGKPASADYVFSLECATGTFSVWSDFRTNEFYVQKRLPKVQRMFTLVPSKMDADKILMTFTDKPLGQLRTAFRQGRVNFDEQVTRNTFTEIFTR